MNERCKGITKRNQPCGENPGVYVDQEKGMLFLKTENGKVHPIQARLYFENWETDLPATAVPVGDGQNLTVPGFTRAIASRLQVAATHWLIERKHLDRK